MEITLTLDDDVREKLEDAMMEMRKTPTVQELGVDVTYEMVARAALLRGLRTFRGQAAKEAKAATPTPDVEPTEVQVEEEKELELDEFGKLPLPAGWDRCPDRDIVPETQRMMDEYYKANGWGRYWGKVDGEVIFFYWANEPSRHDLEPFPGTSANGKTIMNQKTPWGPGHIIPHGW
jgi:hypothetical protein